MKWEKLGLVFCPDKNFEWMQSYASYPWARKIGEDTYKIFFSCRNSQNLSSIGFVIIDINNPTKIIEISKEPSLGLGETGTFDDCGVSFSCMIDVNDKIFLYYLGWNILVNVPWKNTIGLAICDLNTNKFERYSKAPIIGIHHEDPFTLTYPFVMFDEGIYKMWYGSSLFWGGKVEQTNHVIKYATAIDGIDWQRSGKVCIAPKKGVEFAIVKPFVLKENGIYKMWFSYRESVSYKVGYAESENGIDWERDDIKAGIFASTSKGWDSEMVCYPFICEHKSKRYMLYNGNQYGKTGFGLAVFNQ